MRVSKTASFSEELSTQNHQPQTQLLGAVEHFFIPIYLLA